MHWNPKLASKDVIYGIPGDFDARAKGLSELMTSTSKTRGKSVVQRLLAVVVRDDGVGSMRIDAAF